MKPNFIIRKMKKDEVGIAIDWARTEGWNPGLHDAECFYQADPNGFFIATLDDEPIAVGSAIAYDPSFAFCGLYIVKPAFRGQGFGMQLTQERLKYVGNRVTGIDGVVNNVGIYQRIGYVPAHKNVRYELIKSINESVSTNIVELKKVSFAELEKFDRKYFPAKRSNFLKAWIAQPDNFSLAFVDKQLQGYGVMRKCDKGYKIGPLFADSFKVAQKLFEALCRKVPDQSIYLDIPEINSNALLLAKQYDMTPNFEVMRMYRNGKPDLDIQGVYGITTFELG